LYPCITALIGFYREGDFASCFDTSHIGYAGISSRKLKKAPKTANAMPGTVLISRSKTKNHVKATADFPDGEVHKD
jgi:hypothetical protein